jgi:polar amino acid transport system permease protein
MDDLLLYAGQLAIGALVTLKLALTVLGIGLLSGVVLACIKMSKLTFIARPIDFVTSVIRGLPEFLIILVVYFGLSNLLQNWFDGQVDISPFAGGVIALSVVFAAYASEVFRGALMAVPYGQIEAAQAYGVSKFKTFLFIRLPQAWRISLPSLNNMWQSLIKDTSLISVIGLEDMLKKADIAAQYTKQPMLFYVAVACIYFAMLALSNPLFRLLETRSSRGYIREAI